MTVDEVVRVAPEVSEAIAAGRGVVALESTLISHGLPRDSSVAVARRIEASVRAAGAVPATIALVDGMVWVGLDDAALEAVATSADVAKCSIRDVATVLAKGGLGATTVAATALLAHRVGIDVFATGGLGGVHRGAASSYDESADLAALGGIPICVVSAGVKSILDVAATLERLESLSVTVLGYRTDAFPGFYIRDSGYPVPWTVGTPEEVAAIMRARSALRLPQALVLANPVPEVAEMDARLHEETLLAALAAAESEGVRGKDVTPFLLAFFHDHTGGASLTANVELVLANAALAGRVAACSASPG